MAQVIYLVADAEIESFAVAQRDRFFDSPIEMLQGQRHVGIGGFHPPADLPRWRLDELLRIARRLAACRAVLARRFPLGHNLSFDRMAF
jgi:hypothetical protein